MRRGSNSTKATLFCWVACFLPVTEEKGEEKKPESEVQLSRYSALFPLCPLSCASPHFPLYSICSLSLLALGLLPVSVAPLACPSFIVSTCHFFFSFPGTGSPPHAPHPHGGCPCLPGLPGSRGLINFSRNCSPILCSPLYPLPLPPSPRH